MVDNKEHIAVAYDSEENIESQTIKSNSSGVIPGIVKDWTAKEEKAAIWKYVASNLRQCGYFGRLRLTQLSE